MIKEEKKEVRKQVRIRREGLSASYKKDAGEEITRKVTQMEEFQGAGVLFAYISVEDEPDTKAIIECALEMGKTVCVPKCYGKGIMDAIAIHGFDDLRPGMLDIPEPYKLENKIDPADIELGIIPCISANKEGERIGHGAGYYDRFLSQTDCKTACLCFDELTVDDIPMDENDRKMDVVITEKEVYRCNSEKGAVL